MSVDGKLLEDAVIAALKIIIEKEKDQIIASAVVEFQKQLRKRIGEVVIDMAKMYSVEKLGNEIVIHVRIQDKEKVNAS